MWLQFQLSRLAGDRKLHGDHHLEINVLYNDLYQEAVTYPVPPNGIVMVTVPTNQTATKLGLQATVSIFINNVMIDLIFTHFLYCHTLLVTD